MDRGVSPGILTSKELLLSLAGSEVSIGRYAIREKNLTEVVETIIVGNGKISSKLCDTRSKREVRKDG